MLSVIPLGLKACQEYIAKYHRHHKPPVGYKFGIGAVEDGRLCGVATIGRPTGRFYDDGVTAEVTRLCTDGTRNACSILYSAAWRAAKAMGYKTIITYILETETGDSLKASNWTEVQGLRGGASWSVPSRQRDTEPKIAMMKKLWYQGEALHQNERRRNCGMVDRLKELAKAYLTLDNIVIVAMVLAVLAFIVCYLFSRFGGSTTDLDTRAIDATAQSLTDAGNAIGRSDDLAERSADSVDRLGQSTDRMSEQLSSGTGRISKAKERNSVAKSNIVAAKERVSDCINLNRQCQQIITAGQRRNDS